MSEEPKEPKLPSQDPLGDIDPEELVAQTINYAADPRVVWAKQNLKPFSGGLFLAVEGAYRSMHGHSSYTEEANYEYMDKTYSWLDTDEGLVGISLDAEDEPSEDAVLYHSVADVDEDEWEQFKDDVRAARHYEDLDDTRTAELRTAGELSWAEDMANIDLERELEPGFRAINAPGIVFYQISKITPEIVMAWTQQFEEYPEETEGGMYLDPERLAQHIDDAALDEAIPRTPELMNEYQALKDQTYQAMYAPHLTKWLEEAIRLNGDHRAAEILSEMSDESLKNFFMRDLVPDQPRDDESPEWRMSGMTLNRGHSRDDVSDVPAVFYGEHPENSNDYYGRDSQSMRMTRDAVLDHGVEALHRYAARRRVPDDHPELPLGESARTVARLLEAEGDMDIEGEMLDPESLTIGAEPAGLTDNFRILELDRDTLFEWFPDVAARAVSRYPLAYYAVVSKANPADRILVAPRSSAEGLFSNVPADQIPPEVTQAVIALLQRRYRRKEEGEVLSALLGIAGPKAVRPLLRSYRIGFDEDFERQYGLILLKHGRYKSAAKWLGADPKKMTKEGYVLNLDDWSGLTPLFKVGSREDNQKVAEKVFDYDTFDYFWDYQSSNNVDDVSASEIPANIWEEIREKMPGRTVQMENAEGELEEVMLTDEVIKGLLNAHLLDFIQDDENSDLEEFRDAINQAIERVEVQSLEDGLFTAAAKGALEALGVSFEGQQKKGWKFVDRPGKPNSDMLQIIVPWSRVIEVLEHVDQDSYNIEDALMEGNPEKFSFRDNFYDYGESYNYYIKEHPDVWSEALSTALHAIEAESTETGPADHPELPLEEEPEGLYRDPVHRTIYNSHYPQGATVEFASEENYQQFLRDKPYMASAEAYAAWAAENDDPVQESLGESQGEIDPEDLLSAAEKKSRVIQLVSHSETLPAMAMYSLRAGRAGDPMANTKHLGTITRHLRDHRADPDWPYWQAVSAHNPTSRSRFETMREAIDYVLMHYPDYYGAQLDVSGVLPQLRESEIDPEDLLDPASRVVRLQADKHLLPRVESYTVRAGNMGPGFTGMQSLGIIYRPLENGKPVQSGWDAASTAWQQVEQFPTLDEALSFLISHHPKYHGVTIDKSAVLQEDMSAAQIEREAKKSSNGGLSDEQKEAGNYEMGHVRLHGWDISIENGKGSKRTGTGKDGTEWSVTMPAHYGYIKGTVGKDKDHIDVYIGPNPESTRVYVVNQKGDKGFDEHKVMLGFDTKTEAVKTYDKGFSNDLGPKLRGSVVVTDVDTFKAWLDKGDPKKPFPPSFVGESMMTLEDFLAA